MLKIIKGKAWFECGLVSKSIIITNQIKMVTKKIIMVLIKGWRITTKKIKMVTKQIIMVQIKRWTVHKNYKRGKKCPILIK